jgi:putative FmdB family regulatory protein
MPIYTYRCENCGVQFERQQSFNDAPLKRCPECSKNALRKVYLPVGIVFKGSGFYATDHRSPSGASKPASKSSESSSESTSSSTENDKSASDSSSSSSSKEKSSDT